MGWPTQVGYVPALAVVCALALVVALAAARVPVVTGGARLVAGGGILAILVADLLPDTLKDAHEEGFSPWFVAMIVTGTFGLVRAWRLGHRHRRSDATPALLSVHGLVEGVVVGAGAGVNVMLGLPALAGMAIHKSVEGVDLALYLRTPEPVRDGGPSPTLPRRSRNGWLSLNAAAPLAGVAVGHALDLPQIPVAVAMSMVSGLLLHVVFSICRSELPGPSLRARWPVFAVAFVTTGLLAELAARLSA